MKWSVCAIKDLAMDAFMRPVFVVAPGQAVRSFVDEVNRADSDIGRHPADFELWYLAAWDDAGSVFQEVNERLVRAVDLKKES